MGPKRNSTLERGTFAKTLREARISAGLTQAQLAEQTGITQAAIGNYEAGRGNPSLTRLDALAHALGISAHDLLAGPADLSGAPRPPRSPRRLGAVARSLGLSDLIDGADHMET